MALDATNGRALWHAILNGPITNGPITYQLDGRQYVVAAAGDTLWSFVMNERRDGAGSLLPAAGSVLPASSGSHVQLR